MTVLLSTAYWPNTHYFFYVLNAETVFIEQFENYQKQSFRNRAQILSANGPLNLTIPVEKNAPKEFAKDIRISYKETWQTKHWRAITSAYKNSPYFEFFEQEIRDLYESKTPLLLEYNLKQLQLLFKLLKMKKEIRLTTDYDHAPEGLSDLREAIHPKIGFSKDEYAAPVLSKPYYQTFENKFEFVPNLSMLDLLFNKGLETLDYLKLV